MAEAKIYGRPIVNKSQLSVTITLAPAEKAGEAIFDENCPTCNYFKEGCCAGMALISWGRYRANVVIERNTDIVDTNCGVTAQEINEKVGTTLLPSSWSDQ